MTKLLLAIQLMGRLVEECCRSFVSLWVVAPMSIIHRHPVILWAKAIHGQIPGVCRGVWAVLVACSHWFVHTNCWKSFRLVVWFDLGLAVAKGPTAKPKTFSMKGSDLWIFTLSSAKKAAGHQRFDLSWKLFIQMLNQTLVWQLNAWSRFLSTFSCEGWRSMSGSWLQRYMILGVTNGEVDQVWQIDLQGDSEDIQRPHWFGTTKGFIHIIRRVLQTRASANLRVRKGRNGCSTVSRENHFFWFLLAKLPYIVADPMQAFLGCQVLWMIASVVFSKNHLLNQMMLGLVLFNWRLIHGCQFLGWVWSSAGMS